MKPNWIVLLEHVLLAALVGGLMTWGFWWLFRDPAIAALGFIISLPVVSKLLAKPIMALAEEGFGWLSRQPLAAWQGGYYVFDQQHIRIYTHDDELWFVARDVTEATHIRALPQRLLAAHGEHCTRIPGTRHVGLDAIGLRKLLLGHAQRNADAGRFLTWAEREVLRPWERRRGAPLNEPAGGYRRNAE